MQVPKIMEQAIRKMAHIPDSVEDIGITWEDQVYGGDWGCETCGYGKPDDKLEVYVTWYEGKQYKTWARTYEGYDRLSNFFEELDSHG